MYNKKLKNCIVVFIIFILATTNAVITSADESKDTEIFGFDQNHIEEEFFHINQLSSEFFINQNLNVFDYEDYDYVSHIFTVTDVIFFSYYDGTMVALYDSYGSLIWDNNGVPLNKGGHAHITVNQGVYTACGSKKFSVLTGDPITRYVVGYYAMDQNGYGASTELYTWVPRLFSHCSFIVFAYHDNTQVTIENTDTGTIIASFNLNKGEHWRIESLSQKWLHITADKPVSALTCYDQGYFVPSSNGKWSGTEFYTYVSDIAGWPQDLTVMSYADGTSISIKDSDTGVNIWSGIINEGKAHVQSYPSGADKFFTITSDKPVTVSVQPWKSYTSSYHQGAYVADSTGTMLGTDLIGSTLNGGYLYVCAYRDSTNVVVYNSQTGSYINNYILDVGDYIQANPGNGLWRLISNYPISAYSGWGHWNADFAPVEFREITPVNVEISTDKRFYTKEETISISAIITDSNDNSLYPLEKNNFISYIDDNEVPITYFRRISAKNYLIEINTPQSTNSYTLKIKVNTNIGSGSDTSLFNIYSIESIDLSLTRNRLTRYQDSMDTPVFYRHAKNNYPIFDVDIITNGATTSQIKDYITVKVKIQDRTNTKSALFLSCPYNNGNRFSGNWYNSEESYPVGNYSVIAEVEILNGDTLGLSDLNYFYLIFNPPSNRLAFVTGGVALDLVRTVFGYDWNENRLNQFDAIIWRAALEELSGITTVREAARRLRQYAHDIDDSQYGYWHIGDDERFCNHGESGFWNQNYGYDYGTNCYFEDSLRFLQSDFDPENRCNFPNPTGLCVDFAYLHIAYCAASGIPARMLNGWTPDVGHAWVEVFESSWEHYDPTWNLDHDFSLYARSNYQWDPTRTKRNGPGANNPNEDRRAMYNYIAETTEINFDKDDYDYPDPITIDLTIKNTGNNDITTDQLHLRIFDHPTILELGPTHLIEDIQITNDLLIGQTQSFTGNYQLPDYGWLNGFYELIGDRYIISQIEYYNATSPPYKSIHLVNKEQKKIPGLCNEWNPEIFWDSVEQPLDINNISFISINETLNESIDYFENPQNLSFIIEHEAKYYQNYTREKWYVFNTDDQLHNYSLHRPLLGIGDMVYIPSHGSLSGNQTLDTNTNYVIIYDSNNGTNGPVHIFTFSKNISIRNISNLNGVVKICSSFNSSLSKQSGESFLIYSSRRSGEDHEFEEIYQDFTTDIITNNDTLSYLFLKDEHSHINSYVPGDTIPIYVNVSNNGVSTETRSINLTIYQLDTYPFEFDVTSFEEEIVFQNSKLITIPPNSWSLILFNFEASNDLDLGDYQVFVTDNISKAETIINIQSPFDVLFDHEYELEQNQEFNLNVTITNTIETNQTNVTVELVLPEGFSTSDNSSLLIGNLSNNMSIEVNWTILANEYCNGISPLSIIIKSTQYQYLKFSTFVNILSLPKLIFSPEFPAIIQKDETFELSINVTNEGDIDLNNVNVTILLPDNTTTTDDTLIQVGDITNGETINNIWTINSLCEDDFCIEINAYDESLVYTTSSVVVIQVIKSKLDINIACPTEVIFNEEFSLNMTISNVGDFNESWVNINLSLPSSFSTENLTNFQLINLNSTESESIDWILKGIQPGYHSFIININSSGRYNISFEKSIIIAHLPLYIQTDKSSYEEGDNVIITSMVINNVTNISYINLTLNITLQGPLSNNIHLLPIDYMNSGETRNFALTWDSSSKIGGIYYVTAKIMEGMLCLNETSTTFYLIGFDNTPPVTQKNVGEPSVGLNDEYVKSTTEFNLTANDDFSGVANTFYRLWYNNIWTQWIDYNNNFSLDGEGTHYIHFYSIDNAGNSETLHNQSHYVDDTSPSINIEVPYNYEAIQDGITFQLNITDICGIDWVNLSIREPGGGQGIVINETYESIPVTNSSGDIWQLLFDTTILPDGFYLLLVEAGDMLGNEGYETVNFSIRNWAVLELLPNTANHKAGRTIPIKFSLRIVESVDPEEPFVRNEDLNILIFEEGYPNIILQNSTFGNTSKDYRINSEEEKYITNFKTLKKPKTYVVEIWRKDMLIGSFTFETVK